MKGNQSTNLKFIIKQMDKSGQKSPEKEKSSSSRESNNDKSASEKNDSAKSDKQTQNRDPRLRER